MHPLTQLLSNAHSDGQYITLHEDNADKIIQDYLRDRADWLKKDLPPSPFNLLVDQAFELEPEKPTLPEKFGEINQHYEFMDLVTKIDQILDYLKMKEGM